jgi:Fur family iron response transcriptional regulator
LIPVKDSGGFLRSLRISEQERAMDVLTDELNSAQIEADCGELCIGCPTGDCQEFLREAGLRPTRQRMMLGQLLFGGKHRHFTAESLYAEVAAAGMRLSLATVYNTLNHFTDADLLRRIGPDGSRCFFDTDTSVHPHFYLEGEDRLIDVPEQLAVARMPDILPGHELSRLDIVIRIRRKDSAVRRAG